MEPSFPLTGNVKAISPVRNLDPREPTIIALRKDNLLRMPSLGSLQAVYSL